MLGSIEPPKSCFPQEGELLFTTCTLSGYPVYLLPYKQPSEPNTCGFWDESKSYESATQLITEFMHELWGRPSYMNDFTSASRGLVYPAHIRIII